MSAGAMTARATRNWQGLPESHSLWDAFGLTDEDLGWQGDALCAQTWPDAFYPDRGGSPREAKSMCALCPVRTECLEYALAHDERFGIWGGHTERERRQMKKHRREQQNNAES